VSWFAWCHGLGRDKPPTLLKQDWKQSYESTSIGQENLRQMQGHPPQRRSAGDLRQFQAQTAAGLGSIR
jgi:hypothetical protein